MTTIAGFRRKWDKINLIELTTDAMEVEAANVTDLNRDQMDEGRLRTGENITPDYKPITVYFKQQQGKEYRFVTLKDSGEFQSKMFLSITGDRFKIDSSDSKAGSLAAKYSEDIFGLTSENKRLAWNELIRPLVVRAIKNITGAK